MTILTIQSHVSFGHVGNSIAVFPLQRLGYDVWPVQTVLFSNHGGYPTVKGPVLKAQDVAAVISGIKDRGAFPDCQAILSGYLGSRDLGQVVVETVAQVKAANPDALYCCDPVMGDRGKNIYVQADIPDFIREHIIPLADILMPNHFELEQLIDKRIHTIDEAINAAHSLLRQGTKFGPEIIIVTSFEEHQDYMTVLAVTREQAWKINTPKLPFETPPSGAGDLSTALFLAAYLQHRDCKLALEKMLSSVFGLLNFTLNQRSDEIALIKGQENIISPLRKFLAEAI